MPHLEGRCLLEGGTYFMWTPRSVAWFEPWNLLEEVRYVVLGNFEKESPMWCWNGAWEQVLAPPIKSQLIPGNS